jgi:hypothetical protein
MRQQLRIHEPGIWDEACFPPRLYQESGINVGPDFENREVLIEAPGDLGRESIIVSGKAEIMKLGKELIQIAREM